MEISAVIGGIAWLAAPLLPFGRLAAGSIEHSFLFMPLVAAPLALAVLTRLRDEIGASPSALLVLAGRLQPAAATFLVASFSSSSGTTAGALALPWLAVALAVAASGIRDAARRQGVRVSAASLVAAPLFFVIGAVWLVLWRLGTGPRTFSPLMVSLAAMHFHFAGFSTHVLIGATGRRVASSGLRPLHRVVTIGALGGLPLLAAGKAFQLPIARIAGVGAMAVALLVLSVTMTRVAMAARSGITRALLVASAASGAAAVALASVYGMAELVARDWLGIETMMAAHGVLMALGFTLCGLAGHLRLLHTCSDSIVPSRAET
jgi:hypothetical protein